MRVCARGVLGAVWLVCVMPLHLLETLLLGHLWHYIKRCLQTDTSGVMAGLVLGLLLSNGVFQPLSVMQHTHPPLLCSAFVGVLSWAMGGVVTHMLQLSNCVPHVRWHRKIHCCCTDVVCRTRVLSGAGHAGLLLGLSFAFPVTALQPYDSSVPLNVWCTPSPAVTMEVLCAFLFSLGALSVWMAGRTHTATAEHSQLLDGRRLQRNALQIFTDDDERHAHIQDTPNDTGDDET